MPKLTDQENNIKIKELLFLQQVLYQQHINTFVEFVKNDCFIIKNLYCEHKIACFNKAPEDTRILDNSNVLVACGDCGDLVLSSKPTLVLCYTTQKDLKNYAFWQWCRNNTNNKHIVIVNTLTPPNDFKCIWQCKNKKLYIYGGIN